MREPEVKHDFQANLAVACSSRIKHNPASDKRSQHSHITDLFRCDCEDVVAEKHHIGQLSLE